jgi:protein-S-isoprenylcysteine O-methyltransferase Ste14
MLINGGFLAMLVALPVATLYLAVAFLHYDAALVLPDGAFWSLLEAPSGRAIALYLLWIALQAALFHWLPGREVEGSPLPDGRRLAYRCNGGLALGVTLLLAALGVWSGWVPAGIFYDQLGSFVMTANAVVLIGCVGLALVARRQANAEERRLNWLEAYTLGGCRNPRLGRFDLKFFCESRPSMILWVLIDLSLAAKQLELHGTLSNAMILVCLFQILYVADYFFFEDAILTTWDIKHESFGFILAWGCLVWIPCAYALQPLYLVQHPEPLPTWGAFAIFVLNALGFYVFRSSNLQKHRFANDPMEPIWGRKPELIQTAQGRALLTSGWWGIARHANYLGDWLMALAWSLCCGFGRFLPYFYPLYFAILLIHREWRDSRHCASRYGADWQRYTQKVRWRIVPWLY